MLKSEVGSKLNKKITISIFHIVNGTLTMGFGQFSHHLRGDLSNTNNIHPSQSVCVSDCYKLLPP